MLASFSRLASGRPASWLRVVVVASPRAKGGRNTMKEGHRDSGATRQCRCGRMTEGHHEGMGATNRRGRPLCLLCHDSVMVCSLLVSVRRKGSESD
ncbi:hypothetical protein SESBI_13322 [Sesbania bispinosa]|nr:hypothetical protein SESBI_13322 [Sesbania bispinosa]